MIRSSLRWMYFKRTFIASRRSAETFPISGMSYCDTSEDSDNDINLRMEPVVRLSDVTRLLQNSTFRISVGILFIFNFVHSHVLIMLSRSLYIFSIFALIRKLKIRILLPKKILLEQFVISVHQKLCCRELQHLNRYALKIRLIIPWKGAVGCIKVPQQMLTVNLSTYHLITKIYGMNNKGISVLIIISQLIVAHQESV